MYELYSTAKYYDLFYEQDFVGDEEFWRAMAKESPGSVLDVGCGTGRIALDLAQQGHEVVGIDLSEAMLQAAQEKLAKLPADVRQRVKLAQGDMTGFDLGRTFDLIIIPFRSFQHLLTPEEQKACLACIHRHLAEGGRFVVTLFNPNLKYMVQRAENPARQFQLEQVEPETGHTVRRYFENKYHFDEQYFDSIFIYERVDADGKVLGEEHERFKMRWTWRFEMEYLLALAGFQVEALYGDYERTPFPKASGELIFVCRKR